MMIYFIDDFNNYNVCKSNYYESVKYIFGCRQLTEILEFRGLHKNLFQDRIVIAVIL